MKFTFIIVGPQAGCTRRIGRHLYEKGELTLSLGEMEVTPFCSYMATYSAYLKGSLAHTEAQVIYEKEVERINGQRATEKPKRVVGGNPAVHGRTRAEEGNALEGSGHAAPKDVDPTPQLGTDGGGSSARRVASEMSASQVKLHNIIHAMDSTNDDHWTQAGLPRLNVIEDAMGSTDLTRADVEVVAPGWNRDKAKAEKAAEVSAPKDEPMDLSEIM